MNDELDPRLSAAFAAISASSRKNRLYAARAEKEGRPQTAALLDAIADAEAVQARRLLMTLRGGVGDVDAHLRALAARKQAACETEAPRLREAFDREGRRYEAEFFDRLARTWKQHRRLAADAAAHPEARRPRYYVCQVCGFIARDEAPDRCPVCNAVRIRFSPRTP